MDRRWVRPSQLAACVLAMALVAPATVSSAPDPPVDQTLDAIPAAALGVEVPRRQIGLLVPRRVRLIINYSRVAFA